MKKKKNMSHKDITILKCLQSLNYVLFFIINNYLLFYYLKKNQFITEYLIINNLLIFRFVNNIINKKCLIMNQK